MKPNEVLTNIKEMLGMETQEKVQLAQAKLANGTIVEAEAMDAGNEIFIVTEDEKVPMPVGEYELEDGTMLTVAEEGVIASIGAKAEEPEAEEVEAAEEEEKEEMNYATKEELAEVKEMIEEIKAMIDKKDKEEMSEKVDEKVQEEPKEELSEVKKIKHNPEGKTKNKSFLYAQKRTATTMDRVLQKISNIKN